MKLLTLCAPAIVLGLSMTTAQAASVETAEMLLYRNSDITNPERNQSSPTMLVTGQGATDIYTDLIRIDTTMQKKLNCRGKTLKQCDAAELQKQLTDALDDVLALKTSMDGVESVSAQGLGLGVEYKWINGTDVFMGYSASANIAAIVKNSVLSKFIDELLKNGVKSIDQTKYYIPFEQRREAQRKCLTLATENAMAQADSILGALGKSRNDIKTIAIPYNSDPFIQNQVTPGTSLSESDSPYTDGRLSVSYRVNLRVGY